MINDVLFSALYAVENTAASSTVSELLVPAAIVAGIGLVAGVGLAIASAVMAVPVDEKAAAIEEILPGANCGACGYSGCSGYAKALSEGRAKPGLCAPGGDAAAAQIGEILGQKVEAMERRSAVVHCIGTEGNTTNVREYQGVQSCAASAQLYGGSAACSFGCLGYGDCVKACPYGAISVCSGVASINPSICKACGLCVKTCPRSIISIEPLGKAVPHCSNHDKGGETRKICKTGCIGCMRCVKACTTGAVTISAFCATVDSTKCSSCGECIKVCPNHVISLSHLPIKPQTEEEAEF